MNYFSTGYETSAMVSSVDQTIASLREGDELQVPRLSDLAKSVADVLAKLKIIHGRGAVLVETATGRRSDQDLAAMLHDALPKLRKGLVKRVAKKNGSKGGRPAKTRMATDKAEAIWFDLRIPTNKLALKKMTGWTNTLANKMLGGSGRPKVGRPKLPKK